MMDTEYKERQHSIWGAIPVEWVGVVVPDGDALPFVRAPVGSRYTYLDKTNGRQRTFTKLKADSRDDDWVERVGVITQTVTFSQFTDGGSTAGTKTLSVQIPAGAWVMQTVLENVTGFTGDTSAVLTVGDGTDVDRYNTGTPSVFTTVAAVDMGVPSGTKIHTTAATVTLTVTSGADFTAVAAGQLTIRIYYLK